MTFPVPTRLRGFPGDHRRDHELFTDALGRILADRGTVSYRRTAAPANATEILAVKETAPVKKSEKAWLMDDCSELYI